MSSESKKNWERAWSAEEIVDHADNWNLACDAALLNTLKTFGDKVLNKSEEVHKKVDNLCNNLDQISLRVDLARNEFNSLRNNQFVECRVYEEDETLPTKQEQEEKADKDVPKEETMEDLKKAVELGLEILDKYYDKVEVTVSDSEDDDDDEEVPSYVYRRKDPYLHRPLPYVIGSEEWYKKWHVGLQESSDSENEKSASDKFSDSDDEDNFEVKDHSDVSSELSNFSGSNNTKGKPAAVSTANTTQHNDFLSSTGGSNSLEPPTPKVLSFAEQLAAKLGNVIKENESLLEEPQVNRRPIQKKPSDYGALFSDEPPPLDDSVIKKQETQGIFSGGKGLFDDEDDDNDSLWNPVKSNTSSTDQLGFNKSGKTAAKIIQSKGLFDEDSDDDIFAAVQSGIKNQIKQPYLQSKKPAAPVFHEEPPILEEEKEVKEKKKPAGGVSVFGKTDIFQNRNIGDILKQRRVSSSEESNEDISSPRIIGKIPEPKTNTVSKQEGSFQSINNEKIDSNKSIISNVPKLTEIVEEKRPNEKKNSLFEDNEPTGLENVKPKNNQSSLFDDIFGDDLFSDDTNKKFSSNLFSEEDFFSGGEITKPAETNKKTSESSSYFVSKKDETALSKDKLFEDIEQPSNIKNEYDYSWRDYSKNKIGSLFDDTNDDNFDTFLPNKSNFTDGKNNNNNKKKDQTSEDFHSESTRNETGKNKKPTINLFDDEFDDVDDLFSKILKQNKKETKSSLKDPQKKLLHLKDHKSEADSLKRVEKVPIIPSKESEVTAKSTIVQKTKPNSNSMIKKEADRSELIAEKLVDGSEFNDSTTSAEKILDNSVRSKQESFNREENLKPDNTQRLGNIPGVHTLPGGKANENIISNPKVKVGNDANITTVHSRSSMNIPHVNFLDSIPPPDDGWDNASDNIFDDVEPYGNDGFQSQPSSLFDNEPPSLFFNDTSGIIKDDVENRIDSVNSFDPSVTSSRRLSSDIFNDTQNDSFLINKNQEGTNIANQPNLQSVPEISDFFSEDNTDLTPSGNPDDLYSSVIDSVTEKEKSISTIGSTSKAIDSFVAKSNEQNASDALPDNSHISDNLSKFADERYVDENKSLKPSFDTNNQTLSGEDIKKGNSATNFENVEEVGAILLDNDTKTKDLHESEKPDVKNNYIGRHVISDSVSETESKSVSMFDDIFDKSGEDVFSLSKGFINEPKISLKSDTINPSLNDLNNETDSAAIFETVNKAKVVNPEAEDIFTKTGSLFNVFGEQQTIDIFSTGESSDNKLKISSKPSVSKTKPTRKIHFADQSDKSISIKNTTNIKSDGPDLFDTEFVPFIEKIEDTSMEKEDLTISAVVPVKKSISLFDAISDENTTEDMNQVISQTLQDYDTDDYVNRENVISDNVNIDKDTVVNANDQAKESLQQEESDEMPNNISKITELLQQTSNKQEDKPKTTVVPGKLSHHLNINVSALLPGSAPPRRDKVQSPDAKTAEVTREKPDFLTKPIPILRTQSETHSVEKEYKLEKSVSFDNAADVEVLQSVTKNRPKIPVKRRPSSRKARQQSLKDSVPDITITDDSIPGEKYEDHNAKDQPSSAPKKDSSDLHPEVTIAKQNKNLESGESSGVDNQDQTPERKKETNDEPVYVPDAQKEDCKNDMKKVSLFDEKKDEAEDLFRTIHKDIKNVNRAKIINTKKEDILSEGDLFRNTLSERKEDTILPKTTTRKLDNKKTEVTNLFDSSDDSDELVTSNKETSDSSRNDEITRKKNKPSISIIGNIAEKDSSYKSDNENNKSKALFDSSDEDDDFLKSLAARKNSRKENTSRQTLPVKMNTKSGNKKLFDEENSDKDIFGRTSSSKTAKHDIQPSVINKKTPKSSSLRKLENVEGDEDPLSALLK